MTAPDPDTDPDSEPNLKKDLQLVALAFQRAKIIVDQHDGGMLQGDIPAEAGVLVSRAVLALVELLESGTRDMAALQTNCETLENERNAALIRARAAEAEQLPPEWHWRDTITASASTGSEFCRANPDGGDLQMIGMIPDQVQTACLARIARLNAAARATRADQDARTVVP